MRRDARRRGATIDTDDSTRRERGRRHHSLSVRLPEQACGVAIDPRDRARCDNLDVSSPAVVRRPCVARTASSAPARRRPTSCSPTPRTGASIRRPSSEALAGVLDQVGWVAAGPRQPAHRARRRRPPPRRARHQPRRADHPGPLRRPLTRGGGALVLASLDPLAAMATTDEAKLRELLAEVSVDSEALAAMLAALAPAEPRTG